MTECFRCWYCHDEMDAKFTVSHTALCVLAAKLAQQDIARELANAGVEPSDAPDLSGW